MGDLYFYLLFLILMKVTSAIGAAFRFTNYRLAYFFVSLSFLFFVIILLRIFSILGT